jgi:hypothetical protein
MATKKKPASAADFRKKEEADKKKMKSSSSSGPTYNGKTVKWDKPGTRNPTEAITQKGQKSTGLAKPTVKDRFSSTAKTPVYQSTTGLRGSGTPLGTSIGINPLNKGRIVNTLAIAAAGGSASRAIVKPITKKVVSQAAKETAKKAASSAQKAANAATKARADRYYESLLNKALKASPNGKLSGKDIMDIARRAEAMAKQVTKK